MSIKVKNSFYKKNAIIRIEYFERIVQKTMIID